MRRKRVFRIFILFASVISSVLAMGTELINKELNIVKSEKLCDAFWIIAIVLITFLIVEFLFSHHIYMGIKYFWHYTTIYYRLERQMIDAGFGIMRGNYIELPKIKLTLSKGLSQGTLKIRNKLKFDTKFDNMAFTPALGKYIVERHYLSPDGNYYIYELLDGSCSFKLTFNSMEEFLSYNDTVPTYKLFLDARTHVKLQHTLVTGMTGSGKTYFLYGIILQMLNKKVQYILYFADPKGSSLAVLGSKIAPDKTAIKIDEIITLLEKFVEEMNQRQAEIKTLLESKLDADYSDFGLCPYVFIFDEYASFVSVLNSQEKKIRDKVKSMLYQIILMGRQSGFFFFAILQKSDATIIDTAIRDNLPLKIVLGNAEQQTYVTTFGTGVAVPNRQYCIGEGVFTEPTLAPEPKFLQCPYFNKFDILDACVTSPGGVTTRAPEIKS